MIAAPVVAAVVSEASEQPLKTVVENENRNLGYDGGSTQVGTGTSQGKQNSQGKRRETLSCDDLSTGPMFESPCALYLEDLRTFQSCLQRPLMAAYHALQQTDVDLCQAVGKVLQQVDELTESTANVVQTHGSLAQRIQHDVLPQLKFAMGTRTDTDLQAYPMALIHWLISKMKNDTRVVRASYLGVLETVQYLGICTQLALDFYECNEEQAERDELAWGSPSLLRAALHELKHVQDILADPSDFWLVFHITELELGRIETCTHHYSKMLGATCCDPAKKEKAGTHVCDALEKLALHYLVPCGQY